MKRPPHILFDIAFSLIEVTNIQRVKKIAIDDIESFNHLKYVDIFKIDSKEGFVNSFCWQIYEKIIDWYLKNF